MRALIFNVFAGAPHRQRLYAELQRTTGWDVDLVVGRWWRSEYGVGLQSDRNSAFLGAVIPIPILLAGNIPLHLYRSLLVGLLKKRRPDVIYVYHEAYAASTFQIFVANAMSIRAPIGFYSSQNIRKVYPAPFCFSEKYVYSRARFAVAVSENVGRVLRSKGYRQRIGIVPFELDMDWVGEPRMARRASDGPLEIGFIGRLVPEKGVDTLIRAMSMMPIGAVHLSVVGSGPSREALRRLASTLGVDRAISWHGYLGRRNLPRFYRDLDVTVVPSRTTTRWKEQFGRVVIESAACGTPVVASNSGELPNVVESSHAGWTFEEGDASGLAGRLSWIRANRASVGLQGSRARDTVLAKFSLPCVARRLGEVIESSAN